jgi:hypothetical protein
MTLSITNTNNIAQEEISAIAQCDLNSQLIALKIDDKGGRKITTLSKSEVTCWQMFLRFFGCGNLAKMQVSLADVTSHLNQFRWAEGAALNGNSVHHQAFLKTCTLANKALFSKWDESLFNNVSVGSCTKQVEFLQYQDGMRVNRLDVPQEFKLNPSMQMKHINVLLRKRFQKAAIHITDRNNQTINSNTYVSSALNDARIEVEQRLFTTYVPVPVPVPVPRPNGFPRRHHH